MPPRMVNWLSRLARYLCSRTGAALVVLLVFALTAFAILQRREPEPSYQNVPASVWLEIATTNALNTPEAITAFREMGPAGPMYLGQELLRKPSGVADWLLAHHQSIPDPLKKLLLKPHQQPKEEVILRILSGMRTNASPAVPMLITWLETQNSAASGQVISPVSGFKISSNAIGYTASGQPVALTRQLVVPTTQSNRHQALFIPSGGTLSLQTQMMIVAPGMVTTNIIVSTRYVSNSIPLAAHAMLTTLGSEDPRIIPLMFRPVESRTFYGPPQFSTNLKVAALQSVPFLVQRASSPDIRVRLIAMGLLKLTLPESTAATELFIQALRDNNYEVFDMAMGALQSNTQDLDRIVPLALDGVRLRSTTSPFPAYSRSTATLPALKEFSRHSPLVVPGLQDILRQTTNGLDTRLLHLLGEIGTTNNVDLALIGSFTNSPTGNIRAKAWFALGNITGDSEAKVMEQLTLLEGGAIWSAYIRLGELGPYSERAVPQIRAGLTNKEIRIVAKAAETLGKIGSGAKDALPDLEALRNHPHLMVREPVEDAIRKISASPKTKGAE